MINQNFIIKVLVWLYILLGVAVLAAQGPLALEVEAIKGALNSAGITFPLFAFETAVLPLVMFACGVGILKLVAWSWWAAIFLETNTVVSELYGVFVAFQKASVSFHIKQLVAIVIAVVIISFFFKSRVMARFNVEANVGRVIGAMFSVNILIVLLLGEVNV